MNNLQNFDLLRFRQLIRQPKRKKSLQTPDLQRFTIKDCGAEGSRTRKTIY